MRDLFADVETRLSTSMAIVYDISESPMIVALCENRISESISSKQHFQTYWILNICEIN